MNAQIPEPLKALIEKLESLPGLGPKSAIRVAMALLNWPEAKTKALGKCIWDLRDNLDLCERCGGLTASSPCEICKDTRRVKNYLCLVTDWDAMMTLEEGNFYNGQYMVLGGLLEDTQVNHLKKPDLNRLLCRLEEGEIDEIILALGTTVDAENLGYYIKQIINKNFPAIHISRLAQGLPLGAEVKYMDKETLRQSLKYRQEI